MTVYYHSAPLATRARGWGPKPPPWVGGLVLDHLLLLVLGPLDLELADLPLDREELVLELHELELPLLDPVHLPGQGHEGGGGLVGRHDLPGITVEGVPVGGLEADQGPLLPVVTGAEVTEVPVLALDSSGGVVGLGLRVGIVLGHVKLLSRAVG